ncbi:ROK family protein [Chloroflexota bacterium]
MTHQKSLLPVLAIDLGGTKTRLALVQPGGRVLSSRNYITHASEGPEAIIRRIVSGICDIVGKANLRMEELQGIIIASAGVLDVKKGIVTASPSLPGWRNIPLKNLLEKRLSVNVNLINDASAAAYGEYRLGSGRGFNSLVYLTVSTGIGGGIIIDGELYTGADGCAGEIGHMIIEANGPQCNCGSHGCLEVLASGTAIAREAQERVVQGDSSSLIELAGGEVDDITAEVVTLAAKRGDILACEVINMAAYYLGVGITNVVNIFNPEVVIIGGGVSKMGEMLLKPTRRVVKKKAFKLPARTVQIVRSRLGDKAGILGAALFINAG